MQTLWQDLRYGVRMLWKKPGFTSVAVLTLALGIGATTAIFSVVDALLLRPLPYREAERIVVVREVGAKGGQSNFTHPNFDDLAARNQSFAALAVAAGSYPLVVTGGAEAARTRVSIVSGGFFDVMGVGPVRGRVFLPEEEKYGGPVAAVVSYGYWQRMLGGRADFDAARLNIDGAACQVVGVMPQGFDYPAETEVWMTSNTEPPRPSRTAHNLPVIGRLRARVTLAQARADASAVARQLRQTYGEQTDAVDFAVTPLQAHLTRNVREGLLLLAGAVGLLLLVACANFSNLLLAQFTARGREFTVRAALGAARWRLARQLVVENLLLTLPAAALGALLASFGVDLLLLLDQSTLPRVNSIAVDGRVLLFACGLAVLIAVALGLLPALRWGQPNLNAGLKEAGRGHSAGAAGRRGALVVAQISLTLVLLTGAGLLVRSFLKLMRVDPGFSTESAVVMTLSLPSTITPQEDERIRQFYVQLLECVGRLPGVTAVGGINSLPLREVGADGRFLINDDPSQVGAAEYRVASAGYFAAMKIPLLRGRVFGGEDTVNSPHVAVISQSLAARHWPHQDPIGQRIQYGNMDGDKRLLHIVGVVGDVREMLETKPEPMVYAFSLQRPQWWQVSRLSLIVRAQTDPQTLIPALRAAVRESRADVPLRFSTLEQVFSSALDVRRFSLALFGVFGTVALLIAAIGLYGVLSFAVAERTREIGIRLALGAQAGDVLRLVLKQGLTMTVSGVAVGLVAAFALTRLMEKLLFGVRATDPLTFAGVAALLLVVTLAACWMPARRATKVDPMVALRYE